MLKRTLSIVTAVVIGMSGLSATEVANKDMTKDIVVVGSSSPTVHHTRGYHNTIVYAQSAKNHYAVGEPIKIQLKLKRAAYIYFWTVSHDGRGYLILPNNLESFNRYQSHTNYVVPERSARYNFVSDRAGIEEVYVLATNKRINSTRMKSVFAQKAGGMIPRASKEDIQNFMSKDIKVIAKRRHMEYDMVHFKINVHGNHSSVNPSGQYIDNSAVNITVN